MTSRVTVVENFYKFLNKALILIPICISCDGKCCVIFMLYSNHVMVSLVAILYEQKLIKFQEMACLR